MLYLLGTLAALIVVACFFHRKRDLRKRDEFAVKYSADDNIAHQTLSQINPSQQQNPFWSRPRYVDIEKNPGLLADS